jgi:hypothetical protein
MEVFLKGLEGIIEEEKRKYWRGLNSRQWFLLNPSASPNLPFVRSRLAYACNTQLG